MDMDLLEVCFVILFLGNLSPSEIHQLMKLIAGAGIESEEFYIYKGFNLHSASPQIIGGVNVLVPLGPEALSILMGPGYNSTDDWHGSILDNVPDPKIKVIPTFHPKDMRGGGWRVPTCVRDLKRALGVSQGIVQAHKPKVVTVKTPQQLENYFAESVGKLVAFDIETSQMGGEHITMIGFSNDGITSWVVSFLDPGAGNHMEMLQVLAKWMGEDRGIKWTGQNSYNFDIPKIQEHWGFRVQGIYMDTFVAHAVLHAEMPHGLDFLGSWYTLMPYWKHTSKIDPITYNGWDAAGQCIAANEMDKEFTQRGLRHVYWGYAHELMHGPLAQMHEQGVRVDREHRNRLKEIYEKEIQGKQNEIDGYYQQHINSTKLTMRLSRLSKLQKEGRTSFKYPNKKKGKLTRKNIASFIKQTRKAIEKNSTLNVRSPKQLCTFLYKTLKLPKRLKGGKLTTDEHALNTLCVATGHEFLKLIIQLRQLENKLSKYGHMELSRDDRVFTTYKFVESGRLSSGGFEAK